MSETITSEGEKISAAQVQRIASWARFTDQGPAVPWGVVGSAFGWIASYSDSPDYEGAVIVTLKRGDSEVEFTPDGAMLRNTATDSVNNLCDDEAILAVLRFVH
jgi:hypothetical protein